MSTPQLNENFVARIKLVKKDIKYNSEDIIIDTDDWDEDTETGDQEVDEIGIPFL